MNASTEEEVHAEDSPERPQGTVPPFYWCGGHLQLTLKMWTFTSQRTSDSEQTYRPNPLTILDREGAGKNKQILWLLTIP